jgi:hypothetical protein
MRGSRFASASSPICFEKYIRGDDNKIRASTCLVRAVSKAGHPRHSHFHNFSFERERPSGRLRRCELRRVEARDAKNCYAREPRNDLFEQAHLFPLNSGISRNIPVILPPGRASLLTYPIASGSLSKSSATTGMLVVTFLTAATDCGVGAKITFTLSRTRSPASSVINSGLKFVKRYSIARFLPSVARFRQTPPECGNQIRDRLGPRRVVEEADHQSRRLLRARSERPYRRAGNHRYEVIAPYISLPPRVG